jgi:hypothetical protein
MSRSVWAPEVVFLDDASALEGTARRSMALAGVRAAELNIGQNLDDFASLFDAGNRQLRSVSFDEIYFIASRRFASAWSSRPTSVIYGVHTLQIFADQLAKWLISSSCRLMSKWVVRKIRIHWITRLYYASCNVRLTIKRLAAFRGDLSPS